MRSRLIVNPVAGADTAPDYILMMNARLRERLGEMDIVITLAEGDARRAAERAVLDGCDHVFVAGGDGTLNEAINGVAGVTGGLDAVTFGVIPLGTGNDFASALGLPEDVERAMEILLRGITRRVDVGRLNEHYFVNISAGGFLAEVSDAVNPTLKTIVGKLAYLIGGTQVLLHYLPVEADFRIVSPAGSGPSHVTLQAFAVCNAKLVGGGRLIAPHARIDDGQFDVCLIHAMPIVEFVALLRRVSDGEHVEDDRVSYFLAQELELTFNRAIKVNVDGQVIETDRCHYSLIPAAARFLTGSTD